MPHVTVDATAINTHFSNSTISVGDRCTGSIGPGMCVLLGISTKDTEKEIEWMLVHLSYFTFSTICE